MILPIFTHPDVLLHEGELKALARINSEGALSYLLSLAYAGHPKPTFALVSRLKVFILLKDVIPTGHPTDQKGGLSSAPNHSLGEQDSQIDSYAKFQIGMCALATILLLPVQKVKAKFVNQMTNRLKAAANQQCKEIMMVDEAHVDRWITSVLDSVMSAREPLEKVGFVSDLYTELKEMGMLVPDTTSASESIAAAEQRLLERMLATCDDELIAQAQRPIQPPYLALCSMVALVYKNYKATTLGFIEDFLKAIAALQHKTFANTSSSQHLELARSWKTGANAPRPLSYLDAKQIFSESLISKIYGNKCVVEVPLAAEEMLKMLPEDGQARVRDVFETKRKAAEDTCLHDLDAITTELEAKLNPYALLMEYLPEVKGELLVVLPVIESLRQDPYIFMKDRPDSVSAANYRILAYAGVQFAKARNRLRKGYTSADPSATDNMDQFVSTKIDNRFAEQYSHLKETVQRLTYNAACHTTQQIRSTVPWWLAAASKSVLDKCRARFILNKERGNL